MKIKSLILIPLLSLLALPGCDEVEPSDIEQELEEVEIDDDALRAEIEGGEVQAADFGEPDFSEVHAEIDALREQNCRHDGKHDGPPEDFAIERARGLDEPYFRVDEDQQEAARALAEEEIDEEIDVGPGPDAEYLAAQERYVAQKDGLDADQRAARKEALLGE